MELIDTHSHIYDEAFDQDFSDVVRRAVEAGVKALVLPGIDSLCHARLTGVAQRFPDFAYPCIGLHPTSVSESWKEEFEFVKKHTTDGRFYAIGEIGLDEYWSKDYLEQQKEALRQQIELAAALDLPVIIHIREATEDFINVLEDMRGVPVRGTMHAFTGSYETYRTILEYGDFKFGIGGVVTYKNAGIARTVERMSLSDIVLETDCPWLTPVPFRGKRNESSYVKYVADKIAQVKNVPVGEVAHTTTHNARTLFNLI